MVDIGGNIGKYSEELRRNFKDAEIHIFEPSSLNCKRIEEKFKNDSRITINQKAVANTTGNLELFSNQPGSSLASLTKRKVDHFNMQFNEVEIVPVIRFEDYWTSILSERQIDFVKIDVEGHELDVLKGLGRALKKIQLIQFEFGGTNIDTKTYFQDFWYFFKDKFDIYRITPLGLQRIHKYSEVEEYFSVTNFLCKKKDTL